MTWLLGRTLILVTTCATLLVASPSVARADDTAAAEALFNEGRALLDKGRYEEACERFIRSQQIDPAVGTFLNIGECSEKQNKIASAWAAYRQAESLATQRKDERRAALAKQAAARVEPRLARLTINIDKPPPDVSIVRNGTPVANATLNTPVPIDAGPQTIVVSAPHHKAWETKLTIADAEQKAIRVPPLEPTDTDTVEPPPKVITPPPNESQRTIALGLEIGGGVVLAGGLVFGLLAMGKWGTVEDVCPNATCATEADRQRYTSDVDGARTFALVSTIGIAAGAVALATGIVLHLTAPSSKESPSKTRLSTISIAPARMAGNGTGFVATFGL